MKTDNPNLTRWTILASKGLPSFWAAPTSAAVPPVKHAPQTIRRSGIKAVIAESFAEIFFGNSTGIGLPCVCASAADIAALARHISDHPETEVTIDLLNMTVSWKEGSFPIRMPAEAREALTRGRWDSIAELLVNMDAVEKKNKELPQVAASC